MDVAPLTSCAACVREAPLISLSWRAGVCSTRLSIARRTPHSSLFFWNSLHLVTVPAALQGICNLFRFAAFASRRRVTFFAPRLDRRVSPSPTAHRTHLGRLVPHGVLPLQVLRSGSVTLRLHMTTPHTQHALPCRLWCHSSRLCYAPSTSVHLRFGMDIWLRTWVTTHHTLLHTHTTHTPHTTQLLIHTYTHTHTWMSAHTRWLPSQHAQAIYTHAPTHFASLRIRFALTHARTYAQMPFCAFLHTQFGSTIVTAGIFLSLASYLAYLLASLLHPPLLRFAALHTRWPPRFTSSRHGLRAYLGLLPCAPPSPSTAYSTSSKLGCTAHRTFFFFFFCVAAHVASRISYQAWLDSITSCRT